jgi:hypothetical protein
MSNELGDDSSLRTDVRQDPDSDVGSMPVEKKDKWASVFHLLLPSFNPREEHSLQPVDEQNFCYTGFRGRSYRVIVLVKHFKIC